MFKRPTNNLISLHNFCNMSHIIWLPHKLVYFFYSYLSQFVTHERLSMRLSMHLSSVSCYTAKLDCRRKVCHKFTTTAEGSWIIANVNHRRKGREAVSRQSRFLSIKCTWILAFGSVSLSTVCKAERDDKFRDIYYSRFYDNSLAQKGSN